MRTLKVALLGKDEEQLRLLKARVEATLAGETVLSRCTLPTIAADPIVRHLQQLRPDVVLVDTGAAASEEAAVAIELLREQVGATVFALGALNQPQTIIRSMRAGACEFLDQNVTSAALMEAFARLHASLQRRKATGAQRGSLIAVLSAKGGCGATTVAVNTAIALQAQQSRVALVDLAPLGHAPLHLNVKPQFGLLDALRNLHRMDSSLLEGFMTEVPGGLRLLAGLNTPTTLDLEDSELALLFDLLLEHYKWVIVDGSNRMDKVSRTICDHSDLVLVVVQADVSSLWSAGRLREFLGGEPGSERIQLLVNRYRKIAGFSDADAEAATHCPVFWKVPNQFHAIGPAIDRGSPVAFQSSSEIGRSFAELAQALGKLRGSVHMPAAQPEHERSKKKQESEKVVDRLIRLSSAPAR